MANSDVEFELVTNNTVKIEKLFEDTEEKILEAIGLQATSYAKQNLQKKPVRKDTGYLTNSIAYALSGKAANISHYEADKPKKGSSAKRVGTYSGQAPSDGNEKAVYIGSGAEYAGYVHEGTRKMAPNRFLKNAVEEHKDTYKAIAEKMMKNA